MAGAQVAALYRLESLAAVRAVAEWSEPAGPSIAIEGTATLVDEERNLIVIQSGGDVIAFIPDTPVSVAAVGSTVKLEAEAAWPLCAELPEFPHQPARREFRSSFETESSAAESFYVARFRGLIHPPATGRYRFAIASDDSSVLLLGTGPDPATRRIIASMHGSARERDWSRTAGQRSEELLLEAGRAYYIEAIHHQNLGPAHLSVAWDGPGIDQATVPGEVLSPWGPAANSVGVDHPVRGPHASKGMILREVWTDRAIEDPQTLAAPRQLESTLVLHRASISTIGPGRPPGLLHWTLGRPMKACEDFRWCTVEGTVEAMERHGTALVLELADQGERGRVVVARRDGDAPSEWRGRRVRATGVAESAWSSDGQRRLERIWLQSLDDLTPLSQPLDYESAPQTTLAELVSRGSSGDGAPVRVLGRVVAKSDTELVLQDAGTFRGYVSTNGSDWEYVGEPVELPMEPTVLVGLAASSRSSATAARVVFEGTKGAAPPLNLTDIGQPDRPGRLAIDESSITIEAVGNEIGNPPDQFSFAHAPLAGAGNLITRLTSFDSTTPEAKAGIMIRASLAADAQYVGLFQVVENGQSTVRLQWRRAADGYTARMLPETGKHRPTPIWLRLERYFNSVVVRPHTAAEVEVGDEVEAIGMPSRSRDTSVLANAWVRRAGRSLIAPHLHWRPLVEVARLNGDVPPPRLDVFRLRGVVTFCGTVARRHYWAIQDASGGTFIRGRAASPVFAPPAGSYAEVHCNPGWSPPSEDLVADTVLPLGQAAMPQAVHHPAEYLLPRRGEGTWIQIEGVLRAALADGLAEFKADGEVLQVAIPEVARADLERLVNARVRLRGVIAYPSEREALLLVPSTEFVETIAPPSAEPFAQPLESIQSLTAESARHRARQFTRIAGTVTYDQQSVAYVQDDTGGARVELAEPVAFSVGAAVEVVGFPDWSDKDRIVLRHARIRAQSTPPRDIPPATVEPADLEQGSNLSRLVRLRATMLRSGRHAEGETMELEAGGRLFRASLFGAHDLAESIPPGSTLELTGIVTLEAGADLRESAARTNAAILPVRVLLRSPVDVVVLRKPPWWVVKRTLLFAGILGVAALLGLTWIHVLRRRVRLRTAERDATLARLEREVRTSATFAERDRLAGEIHDGFAQGLNAIVIQLETTAKQPSCPDEVRSDLLLARNMAVFSRNEVQHALWGLQSPLLEDSELPVALQKLLGQIAPEELLAAFTVSGEHRRLPSATEHHLLRIVQEAVNNTVKHAAARTVRVSLHYEPGRIVLEVADDGRGFEPARSIEPGCFGLRSLRNRAAKIGGAIRIESAPERGTIVRLELPLPSD